MNDGPRPILVVFLLFVAAVLFGAHFLFFAKDAYPVSREITNRDGKSIEVLIQGRVGDTLHFDRVPGGDRFHYRVDQLSWKDRILAFRLDQQAPPVVKKAEEPRKKETDPYIVNRLKRIRELQEKEKVITTEVSSLTLSELLQTRREEELASIVDEIKKLEVAIETYKWRNKK